MPTIAEILGQARACHSAGDLQAAEQHCRRILAADASHAEAHYLLGIVCHRQGKNAEAIARLVQATRLAPDDADAHNYLGAVLAQQGRLDEAIASFEQALRLRPGAEEIRGRLRYAGAIRSNAAGNLLAAEGKLDDAVTCFRRALELKPDYPQAHNNLALATAEQGKLDDAADCYRRALELKPDLAEAHNGLGVVRAAQKIPDAAEASFRRAIELRPDYAKAYVNLANVLTERQKLDEAETCCRLALELKPDLADAHDSLGNVHKALRKLDAAVACYEQARHIRPDLVEAHCNLANVLQLQGRLGEAAACLEHACHRWPARVELRNSLGAVYQAQGLASAARTCFEDALSRDPGFAGAHYNLGMLLLSGGDFDRGWDEFEGRLESFHPAHNVTQPAWDGSAPVGRTISVRSEQGLGDTLQFIRYVPLLEQLGARTIVEVQPPLVSLLRSSGMENFIAHGAARPDFDAYVFMLSLPRLLRTRLDNIPADVPYLVADPALIASWRQSLAALRGFRVGIQWQGNPDYLFDALRSVPLLEFAPLAAVRDVCLISLQRKEGLDQLPAARERFAIHDLGDDVDASRGTFVDTAAVMKNLDLVVTSDTATAHLAGALGVPVWVALPSVAEWRWMSQRDDSPWYPGMRLFRQSEPNVWAPVFQRMASELVREIERRSKAADSER